MARNSSGRLGEEAAVKFLNDKGWTVIEQNYHSRFGEIDIIAQETGYIVFVEVKTRLEDSKFLPREAVDLKKQSKLILATKMYLSCHDIGELQPRFDVVEIIVLRSKKFTVKNINLIKNAFSC
ncbi:MAG TPA: YraN family protein [Ruminiclostridium sp.]|nr:YraN family protein [Ruminiclostridium sp.]